MISSLFFLLFNIFSISSLYSLSVSGNNTCPKINTVKNFNLTEYIKQPWYVQLQQETFYLPLEYNYCVTARYGLSDKKILFYHGQVLDVYNHARNQNTNGTSVNKNNFTLCARIPNPEIPSKLIVAPCFLPNIFGGDYWVIAAGPQPDNYQWAIISGGQPKIKYSDGCTTSTKFVNDAGLWLFTRQQTPPTKLINFMLNKTKSLGFTLQKLNYVQQQGCHY